MTTMDLTTGFPRSPRERLLGLPMLPRTIDKGRAMLAGTLGEYIYGEKSSFDMAVLDFLSLSPEVFLEGVKTSPDDTAMAKWLKTRGRAFTTAQAEEFATVFLNDGDDDADRARFAERRAKLPEQVQSRVTGWVDLLDVAEGRIA